MMHPLFSCPHRQVIVNENCERVCTSCGFVLGCDSVVCTYERLNVKEQERFSAGCANDDFEDSAITKAVRLPKRFGRKRFQPADDDDVAATAADDDDGGIVLSKRVKLVAGVPSKSEKFMRRRKARTKRTPSGFNRERRRTKRYQKDYFCLVPARLFQEIGDGDVSLGKKLVEELLEDYANLDEFKIAAKKKEIPVENERRLDWRLLYKLDTKVYAATIVLWIGVPPDPKTGYSNVTNESNSRCTQGQFDEFVKNKIVESCMAPGRLVKLECDMWKAHHLFQK